MFINDFDMLMDDCKDIEYEDIDKLLAIIDEKEEFVEPVEEPEDPLLSHILDGVISYEEERDRSYLYNISAPMIRPQVRIIYPYTPTPSPDPLAQRNHQHPECSRKRTIQQALGNDSVKFVEMENNKPSAAKRTKKSKESSENSNRICYQCGTISTPQWRIFKKMVGNEEEKLMLCNACHRYASIYGLENKRPEKLVKRKVQTRARNHV